jgi:hypothetical protein
MERIGKWAVELAPFVVWFVACTAIKSQILADFIAEWTPLPAEPATTPPQDIWTIYTDGAYGSMGTGAGAVLISPTVASPICCSPRFLTTNNIANTKLGVAEVIIRPTRRH